MKQEGPRVRVLPLVCTSVFLALICVDLLPSTAGLQASRTLIGPMVGQVTDRSAQIWAFESAHAKIEVRFHPEGSPDGARLVAMSTREEENFASRALLEGLTAQTAYAYQLLVNGRTEPVWQGRFTTAPGSGRASRFSVGVSSCMHAEKQPVQSSWYLMLAQNPALHLLLGDNVYADTTDREMLWAKHLQQRSVSEFAAVMRNVPTYAIWDDHDFGPNNSDGTEPGKAMSLRTFSELFALPTLGTPETPGAYYKFSWGDVDFFMLDGRYHRSPNAAPDDDQKRLLGDGQMRWLEEQLIASRAKFKILACGSTLKLSPNDGWRLFSFERKRLFKAIMGNRVSGVLFLSGDVHLCTLQTHGADETGGYPLLELISSGIANSTTRGFAMLDFDTTLLDPIVRLRIIHGDATTRLDRTVRLSELRVGSASEKSQSPQE